MKATAAIPGKPGSVHRSDLPEPAVDELPGGPGVLVRVLGVDGTDREIIGAEYGTAPEAWTFWSSATRALAGCRRSGRASPGSPRSAVPARASTTRSAPPDMSTDERDLERGISFRHGSLTESYVDAADHVAVPGMAGAASHASELFATLASARGALEVYGQGAEE